MRQENQEFDNLESLKEFFERWEREGGNSEGLCYDIRDFFLTQENHSLAYDQLRKYFTDHLVSLLKQDNFSFNFQFKRCYEFFNKLAEVYNQLEATEKQFSPSISKLFIEISDQLDDQELFDFISSNLNYKPSIEESVLNKIFDRLKTNPQSLVKSLSNHHSLVIGFLEKIPELALVQDEFGNSLLFYLNQNRPEKSLVKQILLKYPEAKLIRAGVELKSPLILMIATLGHQETINPQFLERHIKHLNQIDETGKTALHYAVILGKENIVQQLLLEKDIDFSIPDQSGRNALHYIILEGMRSILDQLCRNGDLGHQEMLNKAINQQDIFGLSSLAMACFCPYLQREGTKTYLNIIWQYAGYKKDNEFDKLFYQICQDLYFVEENTGKISLENNKLMLTKQKMDKIYRDPDIDDNLKRLLFCAFAPYAENIWEVYGKFKSSIDTTTEFQPFGVELELVNLYTTSSIPLQFIDQVYNVIIKDDPSVVNSIAMYENLEVIYKDNKRIRGIQEIISNPIRNKRQFELFLEMCHDLEASGAMVNQSTGLHVHINFNNHKYGALVDKIVIKEFPTQDLWEYRDDMEFVVLKQIIRNFASLQFLLQNVMRNGLLFDDQADSKLILSSEDQIRDFDAAKNIQHLIDTTFFSRYLALNLQNIDSRKDNIKGTLEFRCHEGAINPIIIQAWVNFVQRLVAISVDQVADILNQDPEKPLEDRIANFKIEPLENIEDLFYILIAERRYQETWDAHLGSVPSQFNYAASPIPGSAKTATNSNPLAGEIAQEEIQNSPFYHSLQAGTILSKVKDPQDIEQLERMTKLLKKYPDIVGYCVSPTKSPSVAGATKDEILRLTESTSLPELPDF